MAQKTLMPLSSEMLNAVSTLRTQNVATQTLTDNGKIRIQLPQAGLGKRLFITVDALLTLTPSTGTMTVTGGTWAGPPNYAPFNVFRNVTLGSNNGIQFINASGYGLYTLERARMGHDCMAQEFSRFTASNSQLAGNFTGLNQSIAATTPTYYGVYGDLAIPTSSGTNPVTFPIRFTQVIDLTYNNRGDVGYIVLQQNNVYTTLELTLGNMVSGIGTAGGTTDLVTGLTGTNITAAFSGTVYVDLEYRDVPDLEQYDISSQLSAFRSVLESTQPLVSGKNRFPIPQQDFVTMVMLNVWNNSDAMPLTSMQNLTLGHSNNIAVHQISPQGMLAKTLRDNKHTLPDGTILFDLGQSGGLTDQRDVNDALDNRYIVNAAVEFTVPSSVTVTAAPTSGVSMITEALRPVLQG